MRSPWLGAMAAAAMVLAAACAPKRAATPPPAPAARQNVFALLPEPEGTSSGITVKNQAGAQELSQAYQAVRVERADVAPSAPFTLEQSEARRLFGAAIDVLPSPEVLFVLHFDEGRDALNAQSLNLVPAILNAIRERRSTAITITGHTDTTADPQFNYRLGLRRAEGVRDIFLSQGVNASDLFVSSHGEADLLVKTERGIAQAENRRVEVIVR